MAMRSMNYRLLIVLIFMLSTLSSCSSFLASTFVEPAVANFRQQTDLNLVCEGSPAYLLMIDSMIVSSPDSSSLLRTGTQSYSAFAAALAECGESEARITAITEKAHLYGIRLLSQYLPLDNGSTEELDKSLSKLDKGDVSSIFWGTFGWIGWVQRQAGSPSSMADLVTIEKIMARLLELDEGYEGGSIHLFFGGYHAIKPAMLGGKPELSRMHFEKALELSNRQFLMVQTTYAETLARNTMDRVIHDRLLNEVVNFPVDSAPEFALSNRIAIKRARRLLDEDYFAE